MSDSPRYPKRDMEALSPLFERSNFANNSFDDEDYELSDGNSSMDPVSSVVSTVPDRHGFMGGTQYLAELRNSISAKTTMKREQKWLHMMEDWDTQINKNFKKVRNRCRKGIPPSVRPKAWLYLTGANKSLKENENLYFKLCDQLGDRKWIEDIRKDLHRQFPYHEMFVSQDGPGQKELFNVLKSYTIYRPEVGYCQAQAPIAAFLLMHMPAEQAFWCFVAICDKRLNDYYIPGMERLIQDGNILYSLLKDREPNISKLLKKQNIDPILYMTEWFLCAFTRSLPWPVLLRFWDIFLIDGEKTLFKMGLVLIKITLHGKSYSSLKKRYPTMCETLDALRNPSLHLLEENKIIKRLIQMELSDDTLKTHSKRQEIFLKRELSKEIKKPQETVI